MDGNQPENLANFGGPSFYTIGTALSLFIGACINDVRLSNVFAFLFAFRLFGRRHVRRRAPQARVQDVRAAPVAVRRPDDRAVVLPGDCVLLLPAVLPVLPVRVLPRRPRRGLALLQPELLLDVLLDLQRGLHARRHPAEFVLLPTPVDRAAQHFLLVLLQKLVRSQL